MASSSAVRKSQIVGEFCGNPELRSYTDQLVAGTRSQAKYCQVPKFRGQQDDSTVGENPATEQVPKVVDAEGEIEPGIELKEPMSEGDACGGQTEAGWSLLNCLLVSCFIPATCSCCSSRG